MKEDNVIRMDKMLSLDAVGDDHIFSEAFEQRQQQILARVKKEDGERMVSHKKWGKAAAAIALIFGIAGIGVPVAASVLAHMNGNVRNNFKQEVNETLIASTGEDTDAAEKGFSDIDIKVLDVSRVENELTFDVQMTFRQDITDMVSDCCDYIEKYDSLWNSEMLEASHLYVDETSTDIVELKNHEWNPYLTICRIASYNEHTLNLKVELSDLSDTQDKLEGRHTIVLCFRDIKTGDQTYQGEWKYTYELNGQTFENAELVKQPIELKGKTSQTYDPETINITDYALTQNGIQFYGTVKSVEVHSDEWYEENHPYQNYPQISAIPRLHATDDLGNQYLLYPKTVDDWNELLKTNQKTGEWENDEQRKAVEDKEIEYHVEFQLYDGSAIYDQEGVIYQTAWDLNATSLTVYIEEEATEWNTEKEYSSVNYRSISDPVTISLVGSNEQKSNQE